MILKKIEVCMNENHKTNCYIVADEENKEAMCIDPGGQIDKVVEMIQVLDVKIKYIVLTHCHWDHIIGVEELRAKVGGQVLAHRYAYDIINNPEITLTYHSEMPFRNITIDSRLDDGDTIHIGNIEFKVIHTPGHTQDGICLYSQENKLLFSGDTLFCGAWGRTDLPTSDFPKIISSITDKLMVLPPDIIVYPGHGKSTRIRDEEHIYLDLK